MHQSKLLELLRKLTPKQLGRFGDFTRSPYFNTHQDNVLFFNYLQKYAPAFEHGNLRKEIVVRQFKASKPLDAKSLAYLMSSLTKLLETFLAVERFVADETSQALALLDQSHSLGLPHRQKALEDSLEKTMLTAQHRNAAFYQKMLLFRRMQYEHSDPNQRGFNEKLQGAADALDLYFITEKLRFGCEMQNLSDMFNLHYRQSFTAEVAAWAEASEWAGEPTMQIYRRLFHLLRDEDGAQHFEALKTLLAAHGDLFEPHERKQLYTLLLNHCTRRINRFNEEKYWHEYLEINKLLLSNGLLLEDGNLPPWRYTNLVAVGLRTGQVDWAHRFMHDYKDKLPAEYADNLFRYNLAQYHYHQKDYDRAMQELALVAFNDVLLNVAARSLLIKLFYETGQTEPLISYLEATRIFLLRNKILDPLLKQQLKKFVECCTKLAKAGHDASRLQELLDTLPPPKEVMHRDWLAGRAQEQLSGLKKQTDNTEQR